MKGSTRIIKHLNAVLTYELTAINQYFLHARIFKNWGFSELNCAEYKHSIQAMKDADKLIERILFLEGLPNLQDIEKVMIGESPREMLECDYKLQSMTVSEVRNAITECEAERDYISRDVLEHILAECEEHIDWLETQFELIRNLGTENYLQSQV